MNELEIESDSLSSLRAICNLLKIRRSELVWSTKCGSPKRHPPDETSRTAFKRVRGHEDNYSNNRADVLANEGRGASTEARPDEVDWINDYSPFQDGARLQALEGSHIYYALHKWHTKMVTPVLHQEILDEAEDKVEGMTGLRPTNEKLLKGIRTLGFPPRLRDHIRCMLIGKIRCARFGPYLVVSRGT